MHRPYRETEEDTLRKLKSFNWSRPPSVTLIIEDDIVTANTSAVNQRRSPVLKQNCNNYNQDTSKKLNGHNIGQSTAQQPVYQNVNSHNHNTQTNVNVDIQRPSCNSDGEDHNRMSMVAHVLILISQKHQSATQSICSHTEYAQFKDNMFTLLKSVVSRYIVPRYREPNFVSNFLDETVQIGVNIYKIYVTYLYLHSLFFDMMSFANQKSVNDKNEPNPVLDMVKIVTSIPENANNEDNNRQIKRRKTIHDTVGKEKDNNDRQRHSQDNGNRLWDTFVEGIYLGKHKGRNDQSNSELEAALGRERPSPYPEGLHEVAMSPVSMDGDNDVQEPRIPCEVSNPTISFVTSLNPHRTQVADGTCRVCNVVTNRICLGCSRVNVVRYYCSAICQDKEWLTHVYDCGKPS